MKTLPGSHFEGKNPDHDIYGKDNILHRGQELDMAVDDYKAVSIELQLVEASLNPGWVAHASHPNKSDDRRIGLSLQYLTPRMQQKKLKGNLPCSFVAKTALIIFTRNRFAHMTLTRPWSPTRQKQKDSSTRCMIRIN